MLGFCKQVATLRAGPAEAPVLFGEEDKTILSFSGEALLEAAGPCPCDMKIGLGSEFRRKEGWRLTVSFATSNAVGPTQ